MTSECRKLHGTPPFCPVRDMEMVASLRRGVSQADVYVRSPQSSQGPESSDAPSQACGFAGWCSCRPVPAPPACPGAGLPLGELRCSPARLLSATLQRTGLEGRPSPPCGQGVQGPGVSSLTAALDSFYCKLALENLSHCHLQPRGGRETLHNHVVSILSYF